MNAQHNSVKHSEWQTPINSNNELLLVHIIDDEESVRNSCDFLISSLGLPTQVWSSALTFLQQVDIYYPAVIVSDLMMPAMSGQALQAHLNQHESPIALIALTGQGEIADAVNMLKLGAADHLDISVRTVEVHRSQVMKKMQAQHVSELIQKLVMLDSQ